MADASAGVAGSVTVEIGGDITPFQAALARAEQLATAFNARMSSLLSGAGSSNAFDSINASVAQTAAALDTVAAPAAAASAKMDAVAMSATATADANGVLTISAKDVAAAMAGGELNAANFDRALAAITATSTEAAVATAALATATDEYVVATTAASGIGVFNAEIATTSKMSSAASVELTRAFGDAARGNIGRLESALLVLPTRLGEAGVAALSFKGALSAIGTIAEVAFNPVVLALIGIPLAVEAAVKFFANMHGSEENQAEAALKRQKQYVDDITAAFPEAGKALEDYLAKSKELTPNAALVENQSITASAKTQFDTLSKQINQAVAAAQNSMIASVKGVDLAGLFKFDPSVGAEIKSLTSELDSGSITAKSMAESLSGIKLDPDTPAYLQGSLTALIGIVDAAAQAQGQFIGMTNNAKLLDTELSREFAAIAAGNPNADPNGNNAKFAADNLAQLSKNTAAYKAELAAINAVTPAQKQAAAEQQKAVELDGQNISTAVRNQEIAQAGQLARARALKSMAGAGGGAPKFSPYDQALQSAKDQTANLAVQQQALGLTAEAADKLTEQQKLLNEATKKGTDLSPGQLAAIDAAADAYAKQKAQLAALTDLYDTGKTDTEDFFSTLKTSLQNGESVWQSFGDAASKVLDDIANKALSFAADGIWNAIFGGLEGSAGSSGGLGSLLSNIFHFASGTNSAPGGLSLVGENGPELMNVPKGAQIFTAPQTRGMLGGAANSNISFAPVYNINGTGLSAEQLSGVLAAHSAKLMGAINSQLRPAVQDIQKNPNKVRNTYIAA